MIPDPLEQLENSAERWYYDALQPDGRVKCDCGNLFAMDDGETVSSNPYATPVCPECFQKWFDEHDSG